MKHQSEYPARREGEFRSDRPAGRTPYTKPQITRLIPGTSAHEAARLAIEASLSKNAGTGAKRSGR